MPRSPFPFPPGSGTGAGGFALGPMPNTFATVAARNAQAASDATWLAAYDANKSLIVRVGSGTSFDFYRRPISPTGTDDWEDVTAIITGPPGTDGMGALDQTIPVGTILRVGQSGSERVAVAASAVETDAGISVDTMLMPRTNGLQMGAQGGTQISAATDDLTYKTPTDQEHIILSQLYDRTNGASKPTRKKFTGAQIFSVANGTGTPLTGKQTITYTSVAPGFIRSFRIRPQSAGTLRIRAYLGPNEATGRIVLDVDIAIVAGDVGNLVDTDMRAFNPGDSPANTQYTITLEGVTLDGGVSTSAPTNGQTLPYFDSVFHSDSDVELVDRDDFTAADEAKLEALYAPDAVNTTAALVVPSYTIGATLGPGTTIRYTGTNNDLLEWLLTPSADVVGYKWRIWNNRSSTYNLRQTAEGARQGNFIASSGLQDARNYIMQPQEIVDVQVESYSATGVSNFTVTPVYRAQVQSNWNETDTTSPAFIQNKPTIPSTTDIDDRLGAGATDTRYNVRSIDVAAVGDILTMAGGIETTSGVDYVDVTVAQGQLAQFELPIGIAVKALPALTDTRAGMATRGAFNITQAGLSLSLFDLVYVQTTGTGSATRWQFTGTASANSYLVGQVHEVINQSTGNYYMWLDFGHARGTENTVTTPVEGGDPRVIRSITAGSNVTLGGTGDVLQISSSAGGGGSTPVFQFERQNTTLPQSTADNTYAIVDATGTNLITITMPNASATYQDRRITTINSRTAGSVRVAFQSGDTLVDGFDNFIDLLPGQAVTVATAEPDRWVTVSEGDTRVAPRFPNNPENDNNTFFFQVNGDSPTTWIRDMDTTINLRSDNSAVAYELANPSTTGITVNDGEGYVFRHTTGANAVTIFPFASSNQFFIGSTQYTSASPYTLPLNQSVVVLWNATSNRWEGRTFQFLLPVGAGGSGAGGASGSAGATPTGTSASTGVFINESNAAREAGDPVHIDGLDGDRGFDRASIGSDRRINGILLEDTPNNSAGTVALFDTTPFPKISPAQDGTQFIGAPLANDTRLYVNEGTIGGIAFITIGENGDGTPPNYQCARVISSDWMFTTENFSANVIIDTQSEWDNAIDKTHVKTVTTAIDFELPDLSEGSSEVTAQADQEIIIHIPNGNGDVGIRPRGSSTIAPHSSTSGPTYTNASPLPLSGAMGDVYVLIRVADNQQGYEYYATNRHGLVTKAFFNRADYDARRAASETYQVSVRTDNNTARLDSFENELVIPVTGSNYSAFNDNILYIVTPSSNTSNTFNIAAPNLWGLATNRSAKIRLRNASNQFYFKLTADSAYNEFEGTSVTEIWVPPGKTHDIVIWNDGSNHHIEVIGEIGYDFEYINQLFTGSGSPNWELPVGVPALPTQIVEVPTANLDRIVVKYDAVIQNLRVDGRFLFTGTAAADFASLSVLSPSYTMRKNTTTIQTLHDSELVNLSNGASTMHQEVKMFPIDADQYLNLTGTDFTDISAVTTTIRGRVVIKMA